jgi:hypothetical protein
LPPRHRFLHRILWIIFLSVFVTLSTVVASASGASSVNFALTNNLPTIVYAVPGGLSSGACESWANACELRYALSSAVAGSEIWAAAGVYTASATSDDRLATFQLQDGVALYGGFDGTESSRDDRDPITNVTILSGDIDQNDVNLDGNGIAETTADIQGNNSYHVVTGATGAILDGVTITAGQANGSYVAPCGLACGGGLYNVSSSPTVTAVTFSGNAAGLGGGMSNYASSPMLTAVTFSGNAAQNYGGGMFGQYSSPTLTAVTFSGNAAQFYGGGLENWDGSPTLTDVTFSGNTVPYYGGGLDNSGGSPTLTHVTFISNTAGYGGGMNNYYGNPTLTDVTFNGNAAESGAGGGLVHNGGTLAVTGSTFVNNISDNGAGVGTGGGFQLASGTANLTNVTFQGNQAQGAADDGGGGVMVYGGTLTLTNATLAGNSTMSNGATGHGGGGLGVYAGSVTLMNTLIAGNTSAANKPDVSGAITSGGHNLIGSADGSTGISHGVNGDLAGTNAAPLQALVASLGEYGGSTPTVALLPGSPALDAGNAATCPSTDQRGASRVETCDIGAFESQGFVLGSLTGTPQSTPINTPFATPLGLTVTANETTEPVDGGLVTFTPPASGVSAALTGSPALIASGTVSVTATANGTMGTYNVVASASGGSSVNFTLTNSPATATVSLSSLTQTYDGSPKSVTITTNPAGLAVAVTYDGSPTAPTNAGTYTVVATITDPNYTGSVTDTLTITPATAVVELSNLTQPYDGTPKVVTVITMPEGLAVEVTYNGSLTAPTEAGDYAVVVTVIDPNYEGTATDTLTITASPPAFHLYLPIVVR